jgi:hypothetical protein
MIAANDAQQETAQYSPPYRLALVKPAWSVGWNAVDLA